MVLPSPRPLQVSLCRAPLVRLHSGKQTHHAADDRKQVQHEQIEDAGKAGLGNAGLSGGAWLINITFPDLSSFGKGSEILILL